LILTNTLIEYLKMFLIVSIALFRGFEPAKACRRGSGMKKPRCLSSSGVVVTAKRFAIEKAHSPLGVTATLS